MAEAQVAQWVCERSTLACMAAQARGRALALLSRAYATISAHKAAAYLGLPEDQSAQSAHNCSLAQPSICVDNTLRTWGRLSRIHCCWVYCKPAWAQLLC